MIKILFSVILAGFAIGVMRFHAVTSPASRFPASQPAQFGAQALSQSEAVYVYADKKFTTHSLQGFLTGIGHKATDAFDESAVSQLKPKFWRIPDFLYYDKVKKFGPAVTFIVGEHYVNLKGGWDKARPWENWQEWEDIVKKAVEFSVSTNRPVAYWDIWGEPDKDGGTPWKGSYSQFLEFVARGYRVIHAADKNAKVIGPSASQFNPRFQEGAGEVAGLGRFINDLAVIHGVKLEGISWHELGSPPEEVPAHVQAVRTFLALKFPGYKPEIHINEFSAQADHLIPGWTVAWLYYLERANIDAANRACWFVRPSRFSQWNDCWAGLNGLLLQDNKTPQHTYWVHKAYADLAPQRVVAESKAPYIAALASRDDAAQEVRIVLGRYGARGQKQAPAKEVSLIIKNYPYALRGGYAKIARIPYQPVPGAFSRPVETSLPYQAEGNAITVLIPSFADGSAVTVRIASLP